MGERKPLGWGPFVYGGIASIIAELGKFEIIFPPDFINHIIITY